MCREFIHEKTIEVFQKLADELEILKGSKRENEKGYKDSIRFLVRKNYGRGDCFNYLIFLVKEADVSYCLSAWEICASFTNLNEELFYFVKSKMLLHKTTNWFCIPLTVGESVQCSYINDDSKNDLSFLLRKD